jgi:hypothetical protein
LADHVLLVMSNPSEGREEEYNDWYSNTHLAEVIALPGFVAAQRFQFHESQLTGFPASSHRFIAIYEIDGDPAAAFEILEAALESGRMVLPPSIDAEGIRPWCFSPITARVTAGQSGSASHVQPTHAN